MIPEKYLQEYDYLNDRVYLDCSTMGIQPNRTRETAKTYIDDFALSLGNPFCGNSETIRAKTKLNLAKLIHADPEDIFFTANTTAGNNLLTQGYPFDSGDEVILGSEEFVVVWMPWAGAQRNGVKLVIVETPNGIFHAEDFIAKITPRTKVIAVSWVQSASGCKIELEKLGAVCRKKGIILLVDAVQGMGRLKMDVKKYNIDVLASSSFKGMLGVMGAGFCYCRKEIMAKIQPPVCSGNVRLDDFPVFSGFDHLPIPAFNERAARMESGTGNTLGILMMNESVEMLLEIGIDSIAEHIHELEVYFRNQIRESQLPIEILGDDNPDHWSGTLAFRFPEEKRELLKTALEENRISVALRGTCRVSMHFYNTKEDIDTLMRVLNNVLK